MKRGINLVWILSLLLGSGCSLDQEKLDELEYYDVIPTPPENVNLTVNVESGFTPPGHSGNQPGKGHDKEAKGEKPSKEESSTSVGSQPQFKVPLAPGYNWEITQSWGSHCQICNDKGYDLTYGDYCSNSSHLGSCCEFGWDFNLPGTADEGKPALAAGDGVVKTLGVQGNWGESVIIDHGNNICTRYSHLLYGSTSHLAVGDSVCQGLKIGEIGGTPIWPTHLHFQFEDCSTGQGIPMGFDDGNGVPVCTIGADLYDENGNYNFLKLTNEEKQSCEGTAPPVEFTPPSCPLNPECTRPNDHLFTDGFLFSPELTTAASYLYSECALDGKWNDALYPLDELTRAEALKVAMFLFGSMDSCDGTETEPFLDVAPGDWYYDLISCAVSQGLVDVGNSHFRPNDSASFPEAATILVAAGAEAGAVEMQYGTGSHFSRIGPDHWAFPYVETLLFYDAVVQDPTVVGDDTPVLRGDFVEMAANLSPCF